MGAAYGGKIVRAPKLFHGKTSQIAHDGKGVFRDLPQKFTATRYHSLIVEKKSLPKELTITAETADGTIMGLRHKKHKMEGVQFHPESVLTPDGKQLGQIDVPERPIQILFGGADGKTLFILAHHALYAVKI